MSALAYFKLLVQYVPPTNAATQAPIIIHPPGLSTTFSLGYVKGSQSSVNPAEIATLGGMSVDKWNAFVVFFANSKGWGFTPDSSALLSTMLLHVLLHKGVNTRSGLDSIKFEDPVSKASHHLPSKEFLKAADDFWFADMQTGFSIQHWCLAFEEALWDIWEDDTNQILASVKRLGTKHSTIWAVNHNGNLSYDTPAWLPIGYLFRSKVANVGELVARAPISESNASNRKVGEQGTLIQTVSEGSAARAGKGRKPKRR
jgi:hypothetical protein